MMLTKYEYLDKETIYWCTITAIYLAIHSISPPFVGDIISSVLCKIVWKSAKKRDKLADIDIGTFTVTKEASPVRR